MNNLYTELSKLISIPSITRSPEEIEIVNYVYDEFQGIALNNENKSGVKVMIEKIENYDKNGIFHGGVICKIDVSNKYPIIGLLGHLDVVPINIKKWTKEPFKMEEDSNKLYGRGVCDMKAGVVIMIEMLKESLNRKPSKNISLIFTSGEECGIPNGLTEIINSKSFGKLDFVIALEPTGGKINTGVFGYLDGEFTFKGKSCHSAKPHLGENAIAKSGDFLTYLQKPDIVGCLDYYGEKLRETLSVTGISGGITCNIIPDKCIVQVNHRYSPKLDLLEVEKSMNQLAKRVGADSFSILSHDPSSNIVPSDNHILLDFISKIKGDVSILSIVPFWTDMSQTSSKGIPSINFGPGDISQAHTDDEFLLKASFEKTYNQFLDYLFN